MVTQWGAVLVVLTQALALGQEEFEYKVYGEAPRLLLTERRLRLLKRERERDSIRWQQFHALMAGKAVMPEAGFASALYGVVTGDAAHCRAAAVSAAGARQAALVYDWCKESLPGAAKQALETRLRQTMAAAPATVQEARNRVFAALAAADLDPAGSEKALRSVVEEWWKAKLVPQLKAGRQPFANRDSIYALTELLHVIRDNLRIEMVEQAPAWFDQLSALQMLTCYPASYPAAENDYRIPAYTAAGDPDLNEAALSRAAGLALVAYDANAQANQFLQGWLMLDRFLMRGAFGIVYEFLWANPYQPGLSYYYMPDLFHAHGRLIVRSSWEEDAVWFGYWDGQAQVFQDGKRMAVDLRKPMAPVKVGSTQVLIGQAGLRFETGVAPPPEEEERKTPGEEYAFVLGLKPGGKYDVEVDGEEMYEAAADGGGILSLKFNRGRRVGVRIKEARPL
jgi:hypothetical protein